MTIKQRSLTKTFMLSGLLIAGFTSQTFPSLSTESKIDCYKNQRDGSWKYLEYIFIVQPANELKQASSKILACMAVAGALIMARTSISNAWNKFAFLNQTTPTITPPTKPGADAGAPSFDLPANFAGFILSTVAYNAYYAKLESNIRINTMIKFLENWSTHRSHVPDEFATAFNELAAYYQENSLSDEQISEMFEIIQHLIEHSFEKRYPKSKEVDVLATVKTITDIGKNFVAK